MFLDRKRPPCQGNLGFSFVFNDFDRIFKVMSHMVGIERRGDRGNRYGFGHISSHTEDGSAAEAVADKDLRGLKVFPQEIRRTAQILEI